MLLYAMVPAESVGRLRAAKESRRPASAKVAESESTSDAGDRPSAASGSSEDRVANTPVRALD
jgi:hypothetical protein